MPRFLKTRSSASVGSAISVVNAIATGKGATIGIDLDCRATASVERKPSSIERIIFVESNMIDHHDLISKSAELALSKLRIQVPSGYFIRIKVESNIPQAVGLKSSSAVSVAVVEAIFKLGKEEVASPKVLLDTSCMASKISGASLTGAYDDAAACLLGGLVLTDNHKFKIIKHTTVPGDLGRRVTIMMPRGKKKFTSDVKRSTYSRFRRQAMKAFDYAMQGNIASSMLFNSLVQCEALNYSFRSIAAALCNGASAAGLTGKGPAVAAICKSSKELLAIRKAWRDVEPTCDVLETRIVQKSKVGLDE